MSFDANVYAVELAARRLELATFDESKHPRLHGRWVTSLDALHKHHVLGIKNNMPTHYGDYTIAKHGVNSYGIIHRGEGIGLARGHNEVPKLIAKHIADHQSPDGAVHYGPVEHKKPPETKSKLQGAPNPELLKQAIKDAGPITAQDKEQARHMQEQMQHHEIAVRVHENALKGILHHGGFKSVHSGEVHTTGIGGDRRAFEHRTWDIPKNAKHEDHPIYGYAVPKAGRHQHAEAGIGGEDDIALGGYGPIKLHLKDHVKDRTTVSYGDTLMSPDAVPSHIKNIHPVTARGWQPHDPSGVYTEAHVFGGVKLSDIGHVTFGHGEPPPEIKKMLDKHHIAYSVDPLHRANKAHADEWGM